MIRAVVMLPIHACGTTYGELSADNVLTCEEHRRFFRRDNKWEFTATRDGCGKNFALCATCGNRTIVDGAPCPACNDGLAKEDRDVAKSG